MDSTGAPIHNYILETRNYFLVLAIDLNLLIAVPFIWGKVYETKF